MFAFVASPMRSVIASKVLQRSKPEFLVSVLGQIFSLSQLNWACPRGWQNAHDSYCNRLRTVWERSNILSKVVLSQEDSRILVFNPSSHQSSISKIQKAQIRFGLKRYSGLQVDAPQSIRLNHSSEQSLTPTSLKYFRDEVAHGMKSLIRWAI